MASLRSAVGTAFPADGVDSNPVRTGQAEAARRGTTAVRTSLLGGRVVVPGAQAPAAMPASLRRAWTRHEADQDVLLRQRAAGSTA